MAKLMEGREARVRNLVLMLARSLALGYLAITVIGSPMAEAQKGPGDTPVVLIGGSLDSKAGKDGSDNWQQKTQYKDYYYPAVYQVKAIALKDTYSKNGPQKDDTNSNTDSHKIKISDPTSWRILLYTEASPNTSVAHLEPQGNQIHIILDDAHGYLCQTPNQISYQPAADCSNATDPKLSKIDITVGGSPVATLSCLTGTAKNQCRFVLRKK